DAIGTGRLGGGDDRKDDSVGRVCAGVVDEVDVEGQDTAATVETDPDVVHLPALVVDGKEVFGAVFGPFDRAPQLHGGIRDKELVRVEEHDLRPEATAHVGRDHLDRGLGQPEEHGQPAPDGGGGLCRVVHQQPALAGVPAGPDGAGFHGLRSRAL